MKRLIVLLLALALLCPCLALVEAAEPRTEAGRQVAAYLDEAGVNYQLDTSTEDDVFLRAFTPSEAEGVDSIIVGALVSLCAALLGVSLVLKRYSMIGDGLSHVGFCALSIAAAANLQTRMDLGSALSVENVSGQYKLSVRSLCSKTFGFGISAVLGRADTFLMCK